MTYLKTYFWICLSIFLDINNDGFVSCCDYNWFLDRRLIACENRLVCSCWFRLVQDCWSESVSSMNTTSNSRYLPRQLFYLWCILQGPETRWIIRLFMVDTLVLWFINYDAVSSQSLIVNRDNWALLLGVSCSEPSLRLSSWSGKSDAGVCP